MKKYITTQRVIVAVSFLSAFASIKACYKQDIRLRETIQNTREMEFDNGYMKGYMDGLDQCNDEN